MKKSITQYSFLFLAFTLVFVNPGKTQDDCKVLLDAISGQYDGDCKKGLAEGQGTAKGEDTYIGDFKKGFPHGTGTYTWANGDVYVGEFKKGLKDGAGTLTVRTADGQKKEQGGYWANDEYIGLSKNPYEIVSRSPDVLSVRINEAENPSNDGDALFIEIQHKGRVQQAPDFGLSIINGHFQNRFMVGNTTKVLVTSFPFGFTLSYMGETVEIQVYQERSWNIRIDYNK
jgi:hypothetical protein